MKIQGHRKVGFIGACWFIYFTFFSYPICLVLISAWFFILGNTAPDTLEISRYEEKSYFKRKSLIPHRTYTHWLVLWVFLLVAGAYFTITKTYGLILFGYASGGLIHLLCDLPNPTGIPILHPRKRRKSLNWWKSGEYENAITLMLTVLSFVALFIYHQKQIEYWYLNFKLSHIQDIANYLVTRLTNEFMQLKI